MMDIDIKTLSHKNIDLHWNELEPLVTKVIDKSYNGEMADASEVFQMFSDGKAIGLVGFDEFGSIVGFVALMKFFYNNKFTLNCFMLAGNRKGLLQQLGEDKFRMFIDWTRTTGASAVECYCSPAMTRLLTRYGFKKQYDFCRFSLEDKK